MSVDQTTAGVRRETATRLMLVEEAAELLRDTERNVRNYMSDGLLRFVRLPSGDRIHPQDLSDFVARRTIRGLVTTSKPYEEKETKHDDETTTRAESAAVQAAK